MTFSREMKLSTRISYALRRVPPSQLANLVPQSDPPQVGEIALARLEKVGKNGGLELPSGRRCTLHEGDLLAVVFGNRYATHQFEGYARANGDRCDLLSQGGLCGMVESRHSSIPEPTKLRLLGSLGDGEGRPLKLRDFSLPKLPAPEKPPRVVAVCGSSMDSGKTHTAMSLIVGLRQNGHRVAGIKLTGTAAGKDTWTMEDAGACVSLNFVDGGHASTYLCSLDELLELHRLLLAHAAAEGADWAVVEIADGLLERETAALLQTTRFTSTIDAWVFSASEPMAAVSGATILRDWDLRPLAVSGKVSMSTLGVRETELATGLPCFTAKEVQAGILNGPLNAAARPLPVTARECGAAT